MNKALSFYEVAMKPLDLLSHILRSVFIQTMEKTLKKTE